MLRAGGAALESVWHGPGPDQAPTLVFLHEGLGCVTMWQDFPARAARALGWGALVYSRRGYGASDPATLPRPLGFMHDEAAVLEDVLDACGVRDALLVGHSDGASIALIHAGSGHGQRVRGAALMAPHVFVEDLSIASITAARDAYQHGDLRRRLARHHGANVNVAFRGWNDAWLDPGFRTWNICDYLPRITIPLLVIQGRDDQYGTIAQVDAIAAGAGGPVTTLMLPVCGHSPHRDQPAATLAAITAFAAPL